MEIIEIKGAKTFLKKISLENEKHSGFSRGFIFRGQRDADWEIIPSAFRDKPMLFNEYGLLKKLGERSNREQIEGEFFTIEAFCNELNKNGFHIPNEEILNLSGDFFSHINFVSKIGRSEEIWPPKRYHSIIAVAQHYGIPTRFVDWSYDPFVAAYFAAIDAIKNNQKGFLAVYATNIYDDNIRSFGFESLSSNEKYRPIREKNRLYQLVKTPSFFNANLRAQKALFLAYVEKSFRANDKVIPYSFENFQKNIKFYHFDTYKYILSCLKSEELLSLLNKRFYNTSTLFPSIDGCVRTIYETRGWV